MDFDFTEQIAQSKRVAEAFRIENEIATQKKKEERRRQTAEVVDFLNGVIAPALEKAANDLLAAGYGTTAGNGGFRRSLTMPDSKGGQAVLFFDAVVTESEEYPYVCYNKSSGHKYAFRPAQWVQPLVSTEVVKIIRGFIDYALTGKAAPGEFQD